MAPDIVSVPTLFQWCLMEDELSLLKRYMQMLRMIKVIIGIFATVFLIVAVRRQVLDGERNTKPAENIRHAKSIMQMWSSGISSNSIPFQHPDAALALVTETLQSKADEAVKQEARDIQKVFDGKPHYVRFANGIDQFKHEFDRLKTVVNKLPLPDNWKDLQNQIPMKPHGLVITAQRDRSQPGQLDEGEFYLDAEMVDALGESLASTPKDLHTLILLYFSRIKVGEYQLPRQLDRQGLMKAPAYLHSCDCLVIDLTTESIVIVQRFKGADPKERSVIVEGKRQAAESGNSIVRRQVRDWIQSISEPVR